MARQTLERPPAEVETIRKGRAAPMAPGQRRAAIIAATLPLLLEHGPGVTTRQIAEAAGIAEGTIFRAFPDIESLVQATVDTAYDPTQVANELAAIDVNLSFERRLADGVRILQNRLTSVWQLMSITGVPKPASLAAARGKKVDRPDVTALIALLEPHRHRLRRSPAAAAQLLRGLTLAGTHPALTTDTGPLAPEEIVSLLLDGLRNRTRQAGAA